MVKSSAETAGERTPRVLLFYPNIDSNWERIRTGDDLHRPSSGLQYVMAILKRHGYGFGFIDQVIEEKNHHDVLTEIEKQGFEIVGIHANVLTRYGVCRLIQKIKAQTAAKVMIGGPGAIEPRPYVEAGADAVLIGEAEGRLIELIEALHRGKPLGDLAGLCFRDQNGEVIVTPPAPPIEDLDQLPFPHRIPQLARYYGEPMNPLQKGIYTAIIASRGCPFDCTFCSSHLVWGKRVRWRSVDNVLAEMTAARQEWPDTYFSFLDDTFGPNIGWVREFCEKLAAKKWSNLWGCILHPSSFGSQRAEILSLMAKAGCRVISYGAQSASPDILVNIHRQPKEPEMLADALAICRQNGILTIVTYIYGLPGETHQTMAANLDFVLRHRPNLADFHPLYIIPKTRIAEEYPDGKVTALTEEQIEQACAKAFRTFYSRPGVIWNLFRLTLKNNPRYFLKGFIALKMLIRQMRQAKDRRTGKALRAPEKF
ncbi:MAG: radical SAM protein [Myxococcales bacterium]|nr:radical SAM protein [Myxococcales bacterium]